MKPLKPLNHRDSSRLTALRMPFAVEIFLLFVILSGAKDLVFRTLTMFYPSSEFLRAFRRPV